MCYALQVPTDGGGRPKILLTAPSNAAVDELMKKMIEDQEQQKQKDPGIKVIP